MRVLFRLFYSLWPNLAPQPPKRAKMTLVLHEGGPLYNMPQFSEPANTAVFAPDFGPSAQGRAWCPGGGVPASLSSFPIRRRRKEREREREVETEIDIELQREPRFDIGAAKDSSSQTEACLLSALNVPQNAHDLCHNSPRPTTTLNPPCDSLKLIVKLP